MSKVAINFNGKTIKVDANKTIQDVAKEQNIEIPTLCLDNRMKPFASCFICVVEVEGAKNLVPSCSTFVIEDMSIKTNSKKVLETRKMCLDLMLSDHSGDCVAPCKTHCPAHTDVQGYVAHINNGDYEAATRLIKTKLALPLVCGTICPNPCEHECRRGLVDEAIAIRALKRYAAEYDLKAGPFLPDCKPDSGKKVSIVGGGPAGLAAAYYLKQNGHDVHIYEALPKLGGMVRYGIPKFRLPWDKLDSEINSILDLGINVHYNTRLGVDFTISDLKNNGADAVLIAIGAHKSKPMWVENEDAPGVIGGIDFLRKVVLGETVDHGKKVAVIGGGDVAMDCARVAKRLGLEVHLLYRRTQKEMPALKHEQDECREEGVIFNYLTAPKAVVLDGQGKAEFLKIEKMQLGEPDSSGRRRPVPIAGSEENIKFDLIISAIGQDPDIDILKNDTTQLEFTKWKTIVYDTKNMTTKTPGIFTAGDCAFGPNTVVQALAEGKTAADAIQLYLNGADIKFREEYQISRGRISELEKDDFAPRYEQKRRSYEVVYPAEKRLSNGGYDPINEALSEPKSIAEASRCIECGCSARYNCSLRDYATEYGASEKSFAGIKSKIEIDLRHPLIKLEGDKCINCGSCVRMCSEVRQISALSFVERGFSTYIAPNFNRSLQSTECDSCGMCIDVCPTSAIYINHGKYEGPWQQERDITTCTSCGNGCGLDVHHVENKIIKIESIENDLVNKGVICKEGRFAHQLLRKKSNEYSKEKASNLISIMKKPAVIVSPWLSIEETYAISKFTKLLNGTLYFQVDENRLGKVKKPYGKLPGLANIALLDKLKAKRCCNTTHFKNSDGVILIGSYISKPLPKNIPVVAISNYSVGIEAHSYLNYADQLESNGSFLTTKGDLTFLKSNIKPIHNSMFKILSYLSNNEKINLESIRGELMEIYPILKNKFTSNARVVASGIVPKNKAVPPDAKEMAFYKHLQRLKL